MGVNNSVMRCVNDAGDRESDLITMRNLRVRNKDKRELQFGNRVVYLSPHIDSGDGSSSYFSPLARVAPPGNSKDDRNYLSTLPISSTRNTEMTMQRLKKLSTMIKLGNIEGLDYLVTKWQWQYDDIKFENLITPLILAVMSNQLPMVQFLVSQGVEMDHLDLVGRSAIDWSISCNYETIYYFLKSSVTKTASSTASSTSSQSLQSVQIREVETVAQNRSFKSSHKQSQQLANQRVVAFYDDSPEMRNPRRASIDYEDTAGISVDTDSFEKGICPLSRRLEPLKVADHLSPLTQSSNGNASMSIKKSPSASARTNRSKQMKASSGTPVKSKEKEKDKAVEDVCALNEEQPIESASRKESSPDSVRKWMTKRIVAAAEAVIPISESAGPPCAKPRYTRSIRKATSKAFKFIWKKKLEPRAIES